MARLILESGGERREIKVTGPIIIGRSASATVCIDDKTLSREHTQIYLERGGLSVRDLESKNGTFLNGALLRQPEALRHGDRIRVGPATLTVMLEAGDAAPPAPAAPAPAARPATQHAPPPPAPSPARARPRTSEDLGYAGGANPFARFVQILFLLGVVAVGTYVSKFVFIWLLGRIPS